MSVIVLMKTMTLSPVSTYVEYTVLIHFSYAWLILLLSSFICWKKARERRKVKLVARDPITGVVLEYLSVQIKCGGLKNSTIPLNVG